MRRRLKIVGVAFLLLIGLAALFIFYPRSTAPFSFLEGKTAFGQPQFVRGSFGLPPSYEWSYAFKEDWGRFIATVRAALKDDGWIEDASETTEAAVEGSDKTIAVKWIAFRKGDRSLVLYKDSTPEMSAGVSDVQIIGTYRKGTIGVSYCENNYRFPPVERARRWLLGLFGQGPKNE